MFSALIKPAVPVVSGQTAGTLKFVFGSGKSPSGARQVDATAVYSQSTGYGFEPGANLQRTTRGVTSDRPFYFSAALPEGNYHVLITFGAENDASSTTVKAELRRLLLEKVETASGKFVTKTVTVNLRRPPIAGGGEVKLKEREKTTEWWAWDEKLTLEFNGAHPALSAIEIRPAQTPTVFLLGDSTVCDQPREPYNSWGQMLTRFFRSEIAIANHAESGESLKSSRGARRLDKVLSLIKPGDYLFLQYGHNDQKEKGDGIGAFTSYKSDLRDFATEARKRGATIVLVTSMNRRNFDADGKVFSTLGDYPDAVRQLAREENLALIDLHAMSKTLYEAFGPEKSGALFKEGDGTHHSNFGSYELAKCIVEGIKAARLPLAKYLLPIPPFAPRSPDAPERFQIPVSPLRTDTKPLGN